ncbi:hypothetical protein BKA69DRAFT_378889 [Paraphysoderma sedebokerense]|nr:hypothetical protein BKA69DRAFT_378889 [Paraphysoderma sedebokerense]
MLYFTSLVWPKCLPNTRSHELSVTSIQLKLHCLFKNLKIAGAHGSNLFSFLLTFSIQLIASHHSMMIWESTGEFLVNGVITITTCSLMNNRLLNYKKNSSNTETKKIGESTSTGISSEGRKMLRCQLGQSSRRLPSSVSIGNPNTLCNRLTVSSAAVERLFSSFKWVQDDRRNRLSNNKLVGITQIRNRLRRADQVIQDEKDQKTDSARAEAEQIVNRLRMRNESVVVGGDEIYGGDRINMTGGEGGEGSELDEENVDEQVFQDEGEWNQAVHEWFGMLDEMEVEEDLSELSELEDGGRAESLNQASRLRGWTVHPANDRCYKYKLSELLRQNLPPLEEWIGGE